MKSKVLGVGLGSAIFIFLSIAVLALVRPIYVRLYDEISKLEAEVCKNLEEKTGLSLSYKSLSPSVLAGANIKKIVLTDVASQKNIVSIKKAKLSYDIKKFFSKNPVLALKTLSLDGIEIEYDSVKDAFIVEKIKNFLKKPDDKSDDKNPAENQKSEIEIENQKTSFSFEGKSFNLPFNLILKNISVHYSDKKNDLLVNLKNLSFAKSFSSDSVSLKSSGSASFSTDLFKIGGKRQKIAAEFSFSGNVFQNLDGSSALVSLSGVSGADYSVSHLDMLVNYNQNILEFRTMRTVLPFSLFAKGDFGKMEFDFQSEFDNFNPFSLVLVRKKNEVMRKINGSTISGKLSGALSSKNITYDSNLNFSLSEKIFNSPMNLSVKAKGDKNYASISRFSAKSDFIDVNYSGGFNIPRLQPSGILTLNFFRLKNGGIISTEIYVEPERSGFMCFSPQIFFGDLSVTAAQLTVYPENSSVDFSFEFFDYSHADYENSGHFQVDGSFLTGKQKFLQASVSISDMFVDSVLEKAAFFLDENSSAWLKNLASSFSPYVFNTEAYVSSDFNDFSVNAPVCLLANTKRDRELLVFALDGSKETFNINQFDLQFGSIEAHATSSVDFADSFKDFSFSSDLTVNSIPYRFFGSVSPEWISVSGDYDFDAMISLGEKISGNVSFSQFPVAAGKFIFGLTCASNLTWDLDEGFSAEISNFEVEEPSLNFSFSPHLVFSGNANKYGFMFETLAYSDNVSSLDGNGNIVWNLNDGIFDSIHVDLNLSSYISSEKIDFSADFTNPSALPFSAEALKNDFYMSVSSSIQNFPASRFLEEQSSSDLISAELTATGTIKNPLVSVNLKRARLSLYGYPLNASGLAVYDDTGLNVNDLNCSWSLLNLSGFEANFDPFSFSGKASANLDVKLGKKSIELPLNLSVNGEKSEKDFIVPEFFTVGIESQEIGGNFFSSKFPLKMTIVKSPERLDIYSSESTDFDLSFLKNGEISAHADFEPVKFDLNGSLVKNAIDFEIKNIFADMKKISSEIEIPEVQFNDGQLTGALKISGLTTEPEFTGAFNLENPNLNIPYVSKSTFSAQKLFMTVGQGEARIEPSPVYLGKGRGLVGMVMEFNRWAIDNIDISVDVNDANKVPIDMVYPFLVVSGDASGQLDIKYEFPNYVGVKGWIHADNTDVEIVATPLQNQFSLLNISQNITNTSQTITQKIRSNLSKKQKSDSDQNKNSEESKTEADSAPAQNLSLDLDITIGQKVQVLFNPFMRGVVAPQTFLSIFYDSETEEFELKSDINLRGGEISWLNRTFYMKEGRINLDENQDRVDPKITLRAETRERDENGSIVTIIMTANNEPLSTFSPHFSSSPAKSEKEIMELLGNVVSADSDNIASLAGAGGDSLIQSTIMKGIENTLRETLNFDIFSIRTNVLQNSVKYSMNRNNSNRQLSIGNFIDNSTVYMGKYFGSSIYVDSLLHWTYDENKNNEGETSSGDIVFQPEFGFEMTSPFVNIRIGVAPDIDELRRGMAGTIVPSTSMTLSWKINF